MTNLANFNEDRPEYVGFNKYYNKEILPFLERHETRRASRVSKAKSTAIIIGLCGVAISGGIYARTGIMPLAAFLCIATLLIASITPFVMVAKLSGETKQFLMEKICTFLGWKFQSEDFIEPLLGDWTDNKLLPHHDRVSFEDMMSGNADGADFVFCEAKMERRHTDSDGDTRWSTVFQGIMLQIDFHVTFLGRTVVLRDAGMFNRKKKAGMKRVGLVDPKFEKIFEAYGTDQVEARYLLTPTFMQRLVDLEVAAHGKNIRFGFLKGKLFVALEAPNQFEAGSMFKPLVQTERTQKILNELASILEIISGVMKPLRKKRYFK